MGHGYEIGFDEAPYDNFPYGRGVSLVGSDLPIADAGRFGYSTDDGYGEGPYGDAPYASGDWYWLTEWFNEERITDDQNTLAVIAYTDADASGRVCQTAVEYTDRRTAGPRAQSPFLDIDTDESIQRVTNLPNDVDGYYRLVIIDYTDERSLESMNVGFVH